MGEEKAAGKIIFTILLNARFRAKSPAGGAARNHGAYFRAHAASAILSPSFLLHSRDAHASPMPEGNRLLSAIDDLALQCAAAGPGRLEKIQQFPSKFLTKKRDVIVYLPGIYDKRPDMRFPVLYLEDGQNLFDPNTSFIHGMYWHIGETADRAIANAIVAPVIIVGIYNTDKRMNEYTPTRDKKLGGGRADKYGRMLVTELKPFIEKKYRTLSGPQHTGLGGSSLGGLLTVYLGIKYQQFFGKLAVLSPSVWWNQRAILDFVAQSRIKSRARIWLDVGTKEDAHTVANVTALHDLLVRLGWRDGTDLHFQIFQGAQHNEDAWAQRVEPFLQYLFPPAESAL
jgi:predicted alpha/beta superfamily hydrolase